MGAAVEEGGVSGSTVAEAAGDGDNESDEDDEDDEFENASVVTGE